MSKWTARVTSSWLWSMFHQKDHSSSVRRGREHWWWKLQKQKIFLFPGAMLCQILIANGKKWDETLDRQNYFLFRALLAVIKSCYFSYLLPNHQKGKQKTGICRKTTSPRWDQTMSWDDLSIEDLADRCLEVGVWDHDRMGQQDFLGGVRLNLGSGEDKILF